MTSILVILLILILLFWLSKKDQNKLNSVNYKSKSYAQGYWDGYRARQKELNDGTPLAQVVVEEGEVFESNNTSALATESNYISTDTKGNVDEKVEIVDVVAIKAKRDLQNINTALYVASFLLVAAAALFIGATLPESVRFIGVWIVTILFYVSGLYIHKNIPKLHPAATAFVGTGLAILPFTGIAMYNLVLPDAALCWFITSVIGVVAFMFAAVKLRSQVVAYFTIAFVISMATSSMATIGAGLIWYFVVLIVVGSIMTFIATVKPNFIPTYFSKPIHQTDQWIVPLTLVASVFATNILILRDYYIITLISSVYYATVAASSVLQTKEIALFMTRFLVSLSVVLIAYDVTNSYVVVSAALSIVGILQIALSTFMLCKKSDVGIGCDEVWLWLGYALQFIAPLSLIGCEYWDLVIAFQLLALLMVSFTSSCILKRIELLSFGIFSLSVLPVLVGACLVEPKLEYQIIALIFTALSVTSVILYSMRNLRKMHPSLYPALISSFVLFTAESLLLTNGAESVFGFGIWLAAAVSVYCITYIEKKPLLTYVSNFLLLVSIGWFVSLVNVPDDWKILVFSWLSFTVLFAANIILSNISKKQYSDTFWWSAVAVTGLTNLINLVVLSINTAADSILIPITVVGLILISILMIVKGLNLKLYGLVDTGVVLSTIALQRMISLSAPDLDMLVYTHWWAVVIGFLSYFYYGLGKKDEALARTILALIFISFFTGIKALSASTGYDVDTSAYQMVFLVEHVFILIFGLIGSRKLFSIWGAVGVALAVLWMLSGYTYLLLALAAIALIVVAIYYLTRQPKDSN